MEGKQKSAKNNLIDSISEDPEFISMLEQIANGEFSDEDFVEGVKEQIKELYDSLKEEPTNDQTHMELARALFIVEDLEAAMNHANLAIKYNPLNPEAFETRSICYRAKQDFRAAINDINEAIRIEPADPTYLTDRASINFIIGNYSDAINDFDKVINMNCHDDDELYYYRGLAKAYINDSKGALDDFSRASEADFLDDEEYLYKGLYYTFADKHKEALKELKKYFKENDEEMNSIAIIFRGINKLKLGKTDDAIKDMELSISINDTDPYAYYQCGNAYYSKGVSQKALENWQKSADLGYTPALEMLKTFIVE